MRFVETGRKLIVPKLIVPDNDPSSLKRLWLPKAALLKTVDAVVLRVSPGFSDNPDVARSELLTEVVTDGSVYAINRTAEGDGRGTATQIRITEDSLRRDSNGKIITRFPRRSATITQDGAKVTGVVRSQQPPGFVVAEMLADLASAA